MPPENDDATAASDEGNTIKVNKLGAWTQTRNVLFENLGMAFDLLNQLPWSEDPSSDYQKANKQIEELNQKTIPQHAVTGLNIIDAAIADSDLVKDIKAKSQEAKDEADRIKDITKTIENVTKSIAASVSASLVMPK